MTHNARTTSDSRYPRISRPTLLPGLRRVWRGAHRLQLGTAPGRGVVLELPHPAVAQLLDLLDGSRSERTVLATATRCGIRDTEARALLDALQRAGLLLGAQSLLPSDLPVPLRYRLATEAAAVALRGAQAPGTPAQVLRRRSAARVLVTGYGPLAAPLGLTLAQSGVGHVASKLAPAPPLTGPAVPATSDGAKAGGAKAGAAPPGPERGASHPGPAPSADDALAERIAQLAPGTKTWPLRRRDTSFVVQVGDCGPANLAAAGYAQHRLPHLVVSVRDGTAVVGPLVPPGGAPCLNCVDLHRRDRDPDWPKLAAALARPATDPCAAATLLCAAGLAAGEVLSWLDGGTPGTVGGSLEIAAPGELRRRSWPPHPGCSCFYRRPRPHSGGGRGLEPEGNRSGTIVR